MALYLRNRTLAPAAVAFVDIIRGVEAELMADRLEVAARVPRAVSGRVPRKPKKRASGR